MRTGWNKVDFVQQRQRNSRDKQLENLQEQIYTSVIEIRSNSNVADFKYPKIDQGGEFMEQMTYDSLLFMKAMEDNPYYI